MIAPMPAPQPTAVISTKTLTLAGLCPACGGEATWRGRDTNAQGTEYVIDCEGSCDG